MFEEIFRRKKLNPEKLPACGFVEADGRWAHTTEIMDGEFTLHVRIDGDGIVDTDLIEKETGDAYILYKTDAAGAYVGDIRMAIGKVLTDIAAGCFEPAVFQTDQAQMLIEYVRRVYGDEPEFLWEKFPDNAIWRRKDNKKWYGAILTVAGRKIGLDTDRIVEIIDLRMHPEQKEEMLAHEHYYPGWHMNKKSWYTVTLDMGVPDEELCRRLDGSYRLALKQGRTDA